MFEDIVATYFRFWGGSWGQLRLLNVSGANRILLACHSGGGSGIASLSAFQAPVAGDARDLKEDDGFAAFKDMPLQACRALQASFPFPSCVHACSLHPRGLSSHSSPLHPGACPAVHAHWQMPALQGQLMK